MIAGAHYWFWAVIASGPPFLFVCWRIGKRRRRADALITYGIAQDAVAAVRRAYVDGEFGPEELDWRMLLALMPPEPRDSMWRQQQRAIDRVMRARVTSGAAARPVPIIGGDGTIAAFPTTSVTWSAAPPGTTVIPWTAAEVPHDETEPIKIYDARGNVQSIVRRGRVPLPPTEPDPRLVDYREHI